MGMINNLYYTLPMLCCATVEEQNRFLCATWTFSKIYGWEKA